MICNDCPLANICKVFEVIVNARPYVDIHVNDCLIDKSEETKGADTPQGNSPQKGWKDSSQILDKSRRIKELQGEPEGTPDFRVIDPKEENSEPPMEEPDVQSCSICEEYIIWESVTCYACGRIVCPGCSIESVDDKQPYCTDCF